MVPPLRRTVSSAAEVARTAQEPLGHTVLHPVRTHTHPRVPTTTVVPRSITDDGRAVGVVGGVPILTPVQHRVPVRGCRHRVSPRKVLRRPGPGRWHVTGPSHFPRVLWSTSDVRGTPHPPETRDIRPVPHPHRPNSTTAHDPGPVRIRVDTLLLRPGPSRTHRDFEDIRSLSGPWGRLDRGEGSFHRHVRHVRYLA